MTQRAHTEQQAGNGAGLSRTAFEPVEPLDDMIYALPTRDLLDFEPLVGRSPTAGSEALETERGPQRAGAIDSGD